MSQKEEQEWMALLDADLELRTAWNGFIAQLAKDAALIRDGALTTGQALGKAARAVHVAAGTDQEEGLSE